MTVTIRNVQVAPDHWNEGCDPKLRAWREMADYRIARDAVVKSGQQKSPALPLSLLVAVHQAEMRVDQIAHGTGVSPATVSLALKRNGLTGGPGRRSQRIVRQCVDAGPLPVAIRIAPTEVSAIVRRSALRKGVPAEERARLRDEFYAVSERLRNLGLSFKHLAALCGRSVQSIHQWRVRQAGNYPAPTQEIVDDLTQVAEHHEAVLARARSLLETLA
jgi:hypothetical protein